MSLLQQVVHGMPVQPRQPHYGTLESTLPNTPPTNPYVTKNHTCMTNTRKKITTHITFNNPLYIAKWNNISHISKVLSNHFWTTPKCTNTQMTQTMKFKYAQYMGNTRARGTLPYVQVMCISWILPHLKQCTNTQNHLCNHAH